MLEVDPRYQRDPADLRCIFVPGGNGAQVPLNSVIQVTTGTAPLVVNHQGPFPAVTITYNLAPDCDAGGGGRRHPEGDRRTAHARLASAPKRRATPRRSRRQAKTQPLLILAALLAVYIVLGVLYESLAHPLTIISTLPSAGLGALIALQICGMELSVIAFIGIILLIGIVKKNGIMLVDFALEAERERGLTPEQRDLRGVRSSASGRS